MASSTSKGISPIFIVFACIIFVVGIAIGYFVNMTAVSPVAKPVVTTNTNAEKLGLAMKSKAVSSIILIGTVKNVNGRNLTIVNNNVQTAVYLPEATKFNLINYSQKNPTQQPATISDVKIGENVNISAKVSEGYQLQANVVIVLVPR